MTQMPDPQGAASAGAAAPLQWACRGLTLTLGHRPLIMGILNVTPDSFSDGGSFDAPARAIERAAAIIDEGADIIDVGGESTRPGAAPVSEEEEIRRVIPVIAALTERPGAVISIDTTKAAVARSAIEAGAHIINDVSAMTMDAAMPAVAAGSGAGVVLMHMLGTPRTMQDDPRYDNVAREVSNYLGERVAALEQAGLARESMALDPGIGFGKTVEQNLALLAGLPILAEHGLPLLVGLSRKSFLGAVTGRAVGDRLGGSLAALAFCVMNGTHIIRVHDVAYSCDAVNVLEALRTAGGGHDTKQDG